MKEEEGGSLAAALRREEMVLGAVAHLNDPTIIELIALAGYDWVSMTLEHTTLSPADYEAMQRAADLHGLTTLVHIPTVDDPRLLSLLHIGIGGFVLQEVRSASDAEALVRLTRFAPLGGRGVHVGMRADRYGAVAHDEFMAAADRSFVVALAIEDAVGVENAEEIFAVEGVTLAFVGLQDLSHALGTPDDLRSAPVEDAVRRVAEAARRNGVPLALPGYAHGVAELQALGARLVVSPGNELVFIRRAFAEHVERLRAEARAAVAAKQGTPGGR